MSLTAQEREKRKKQLKKAKERLVKRQKEWQLLLLQNMAGNFNSNDRQKSGQEYVNNFRQEIKKHQQINDTKEDEKEMNDFLLNNNNNNMSSSKYRGPGRLNNLSQSYPHTIKFKDEIKVDTMNQSTQTDQSMFEQHLLEVYGNDFIVVNNDDDNKNNDNDNETNNITDELALLNDNNKIIREIPNKVWATLIESDQIKPWPPLYNDDDINDDGNDEFVDETFVDETKDDIDDNKESEVYLLDRKESERIVNTGNFLDNFREKTKYMERALGIYADAIEDYMELMKDSLNNNENNNNNNNNKVSINPLDKLLRKQKNDTKWLKKKNVFKCSLTQGRSVTSIDFCKTNRDWFLVSYGLKYDNGVRSYNNEYDGMITIWNTILPTYPEYILKSNDMITIAMFHPRNPKLIYGATINGSILQFDFRSKLEPVMQSKFDSGHSSPVFKIDFLPTVNSKVNHILSISNDGKMCTWREDLDKNKERKLDKKGKIIDNFNRFEPSNDIELKPDDNGARQIDLSTTCFGYPFKDSNLLVIGSDEGNLYKIDNYQQISQSKLNIKNTINNAHYGPITNIDFLPFYYYGNNTNKKLNDTLSKLYLTSSFDWSVKLWNLNYKSNNNNNNNNNKNKINNNTIKSDALSFTGSKILSSNININNNNNNNNNIDQQYIYEYNNFTDYVYDVKWSNGKPGVFACCDGDGKLTIFDLTQKFKEPIYTLKVTDNNSKQALTTVQFGLKGKYVAVGDSNGDVTLFGCHKNLYSSNEKDFMDLEDAINRSMQ